MGKLLRVEEFEDCAKFYPQLDSQNVAHFRGTYDLTKRFLFEFGDKRLQ